MKFPSNIILDINKIKTPWNNNYWVYKYCYLFKNQTPSVSIFNSKSFINLKKKNLRKINLPDNSFFNFFDINFLKKEKIYTKLKYSRVPQYDTVSGGVAALFAGFLGFLICEKFGFELLDSGDFYFLFMYLTFLFFFLRLFFNIINKNELDWSFLDFKKIIFFYKTIFFFFINNFKNYFF